MSPATYTVVLIDRPPDQADEGDFLEVEGVTLADLEQGGDWLARLAEAMRNREAS